MHISRCRAIVFPDGLQDSILSPNIFWKIKAASQAENMALKTGSHSGQNKKHLVLCFDDVGKNLAEKRSESNGMKTFYHDQIQQHG